MLTGEGNRLRDETERVQQFLDLFTRGKQFTEELLHENQRLRLRIAELEEAGSGQEETGELQILRDQVERLASENQQIRNTYQKVEDLNREYAARYAEVEEQNHNLASLYVASYQLHSTLDFKQVIAIIKEILVNLIGAETFAVMLIDEQTKQFRTVAADGGKKLAGLDGLIVSAGEGLMGSVAVSGRSYYAEGPVADVKPSTAEPIAVVPLHVNDQMIGLVAIFSLFEQKESFTEVDFELFSLLAAHAAAAIFSSQLFSQSERKLNTLQSFLDLLTAP